MMFFTSLNSVAPGQLSNRSLHSGHENSDRIIPLVAKKSAKPHACPSKCNTAHRSVDDFFIELGLEFLLQLVIFYLDFQDIAFYTEKVEMKIMAYFFFLLFFKVKVLNRGSYHDCNQSINAKT